MVIALGAANGLGFLAGVFVGGFLLRRRLGHLQTRDVMWDSLRILAASAAGIAVMLLFDFVTGLHGLVDRSGSLVAVVVLAVDGVVMLAVTVVALLWMRVPVADDVAGAIGRVLLRTLPVRAVPGPIRRRAEADVGADDDHGRAAGASGDTRSGRDGDAPVPGLAVPYPGYDLSLIHI